MATTLGFVSETGVAGLTLGGGFGYLTRRFGWTVDDLLEVEMVTASGAVVRASRERHPDLFWALRGGGGNFGIVTEFVFRLHRVGPDVTAGLIAWSADEAEAVTELFRRVTASAPRELTLAMLMRNAPPAPWLAEDKVDGATVLRLKYRLAEHPVYLVCQQPCTAIRHLHFARGAADRAMLADEFEEANFAVADLVATVEVDTDRESSHVGFRLGVLWEARRLGASLPYHRTRAPVHEICSGGPILAFD